MTQLIEKHALITGGGTGIGAAIAMRFAKSEIKVTITGRRSEPLKSLCNEHENLNWVASDVSDEKSVKRMFDKARSQSGPVNIVVANAGMAAAAPLAKTGLDMWNNMIAVNLTGVFLTLKEAQNDMIATGWGRMITMASTAGIKGSPYISAYCASKHGVVGLTRSIAAELANTGITVNAICPGFTDTEILETSISNIMEKTGKSDETARKILADTNPMGKIIQPSEIAGTAMWLIGDDANSITGQTISISGGDGEYENSR